VLAAVPLVKGSKPATPPGYGQGLAAIGEDLLGSWGPVEALEELVWPFIARKLGDSAICPLWTELGLGATAQGFFCFSWGRVQWSLLSEHALPLSLGWCLGC
jgi:hypothetical protein